MDWESWDVEEVEYVASDSSRFDRWAFRREMEWRVPGSVFAIVILWHVLRAVQRLVLSASRAAVRKWFQWRAAPTPIRVDDALP